MQMRGSLAGAVLAVCLAAPALSAPLRCEFTSKWACGPSGCSPSAITTWSVVDLDRSRYFRCDRNGCDELPMVQSTSGVFLNIDMPGRAAMAKMSRDGSVFVEIVTASDLVLVAHGSCRQQ